MLRIIVKNPAESGIFYASCEYNGGMQNERGANILTLEGRKKITLTGVDGVEGFSESEIVLTVEGTKMKICGTHLKVLAFSQGSGNFSAVGEVSRIVYGAQRGKFFQRLLK